VAGKESLDAMIGEGWEVRDRMTLQPLLPSAQSLRLASVDFATGRLRFSTPLPATVKPHDLVASLSRPAEVLVRNSSFWGNLGHGVRIKSDNATVQGCRFGYNSFMSVLMVPDGAFWMSSGAVRNATVTGCTIERGGIWADAQYDVDATSITVTAYVPAGTSAGGEPEGSAPLAVGAVNQGITISNNSVIQAQGVGTAFLFRATTDYAVTGNRVMWDRANTSNRLVHALNSKGLSYNNTCIYGQEQVPC